MTSEGSGPMRSKEYLQNGTLYWDTLNYSDWVAFPDGLPDTTDWLNLDEVLYHPSELILITRIMPIILAIGLAGNMAFLFVVFRVRWMRTVVNFYLINLAVADIVFLCVAIGEKLGMHISRPDVYDEGSKGISGCMLISFTKGWCYFTSITLVTLVSVGRFYAVCRPHDYKLNSKQRALKLISGAWLACCVIATLLIPAKSALSKKTYYKADIWAPNANLSDILHNPHSRKTCVPVAHASWVAFVTDGLQALPFLVALSGNVIIYVCIFRALNDRVSKTSRHNSRERKTEMRDRVSRMLIANGTMFFLCLAPFELTSLWAMVTNDTFLETGRPWTQFCRVMMYLNSAVNPIIYNITNPRYRQAFMRAFSKKQDRRHESKTPSTVQLSHLRGESQEPKFKKEVSHSQSNSHSH
ncbi:neuropeptides capa receptor-like [Patiria miniata]|uniref:G-protein coupled receptors family 1 profile domain-containing protein n=1 Tax=Patiria miniata TaxID=46514 RepID=A0A914A0X3_PATMI|nr:neuropeptides capa receptor-like [Patiria miniata]